MSPDAGARQQPLLPAQTPPPKAAPCTTGGREGRVRAPALGKPSAGWVVVVFFKRLFLEVNKERKKSIN